MYNSYLNENGRLNKIGLLQNRFQAAKVLEQAGINPDLVLQTNKHDASVERVTYCNIKLPLPKPLLPEESLVDMRLFIVCQPAAIPERILRDAFSRFGNLIDIYLLPGISGAFS